VHEFERRFPEGAPSLRQATSFTVRGDWTFGEGVVVKGAATVGPDGAPGTISDAILEG
jgi:UTP--glucose-1-phosphate uridylyltransferase